MDDKKKVGYKELINGMDRNERDSLHEVYCNSTVSITQLAQEYQTSVAVMRRIIMEVFGTGSK